MPQTYHANATTNVHIRSDIRKSDMRNAELARRYGVSENTVSKWRNREFQEDASSRPLNIRYAIDELTEALIVSIRKSLWNSREDIADMVRAATGVVLAISTVYRCLVRNSVNRKPKEAREAYLRFKEYAPGYLHIDVTYLPRIDGERKYLFVAIDRATRLMFYLVYGEKTAENAADFLAHCREFFPFEIRTILTDNGKEFSNRLFKGRSGATTDKVGLFDQACGQETEHRLTKPGTPKTNGMVERANLTIKSATIHRTTYLSHDELSSSLYDFLMHYNLYRRHGSLVKELKVRTPIDACTRWLEIQPELFSKKYLRFGNLCVPLHRECGQSHNNVMN